MRDDRNAIRRRTLRSRLNGVYAHWLAYRELNLSFFSWVKFSMMNIMKGFMPKFIYKYFHKKSFS